QILIVSQDGGSHASYHQIPTFTTALDFMPKNSSNCSMNCRTTSISPEITAHLAHIGSSQQFYQQTDYGVSKAFVSRDVHHLLPILYCKLQHIRWPAIESDWVRASDFENTVAAIDCSTHYRNRVHPRQADYYRFDKKGFSITAQLICGLDGKIWRVDFGNGHNNDSGMVELTGLKDVLHQNPNLRNLADSGSGQHNGRDWQNNQKSLRSVVETVFAVVKWFSLAGGKYRGSPELQQLALGCIYQLVAQNLNNYPLRISLEAKGKPFKAFGQ
ncbi:hypothetical protein PROFUN_07595, partial [Planoprotostelium fungivorum]